MRVLKIISAVPIILLALLPCIYCLYFQVKHQVIMYEMQKKLKSEQLQTVVIPVEKFHWYEENREIVVDGHMFDVQSIEQQGDNYVVKGLFDEYETKMHIAMGKLQREQENDPDTHLISKMISETLMSPSAADALQWLNTTELYSKKVFPDEKLYNTILSINTPPPRGC